MKNEILAIVVISMFLLVGMPSVTAPGAPEENVLAITTLYISEEESIVDDSKGKIVTNGYLEGDWKVYLDIYFGNVEPPWSIQGTYYVEIKCFSDTRTIYFYNAPPVYFNYDGNPDDINELLIEYLPDDYYDVYIQIDIEITVYYDGEEDYSFGFHNSWSTAGSGIPS
jgi:hypothetical protein